MLPKELIDLQTIRDGWGVTTYQVYGRVNKGSLKTFSRPGHQRYYLLDEVEREFGPRKVGPKPPYSSGSELERIAA